MWKIFDEKKRHNLCDNWYVLADSKFDFKLEEDGLYNLSTDEFQVVFSIIKVEGKSKEELFLEKRKLTQLEFGELILKEYQFNIDNKILYGIYQQGEEKETGIFFHILNTFTFINGEYIESIFYSKIKTNFEWALLIWKNIYNTNLISNIINESNLINKDENFKNDNKKTLTIIRPYLLRSEEHTSELQ